MSSLHAPNWHVVHLWQPVLVQHMLYQRKEIRLGHNYHKYKNDKIKYKVTNIKYKTFHWIYKKKQQTGQDESSTHWKIKKLLKENIGSWQNTKMDGVCQISQAGVCRSSKHTSENGRTQKGLRGLRSWMGTNNACLFILGQSFKRQALKLC